MRWKYIIILDLQAVSKITVWLTLSRRVKPMWIVDILDWISRDCESELGSGDCEDFELFIGGAHNALMNSILIRDYNSFHTNALPIHEHWKADDVRLISLISKRLSLEINPKCYSSKGYVK